MSERERPEAPYLYAGFWSCGDEVCDCTQPEVVLVERHPLSFGGYRYTQTRLWEGVFHSDSWEYRDRRWPQNRREEAERTNELRKAARRFGIQLHVDRYHYPNGTRALSVGEVERYRQEHKR